MHQAVREREREIGREREGQIEISENKGLALVKDVKRQLIQERKKNEKLQVCTSQLEIDRHRQGERDTHRDRHGERESHTDRHGERETHTNRHGEREICRERETD